MTKPIAVMALDPGGITGCAVWLPYTAYPGIQVTEYDCLEASGLVVLAEELVQRSVVALQQGCDFHLVYEGFNIDPNDNRSAIDLTAPQVIGVIRLESQMRVMCKLVVQPREIGRKFWTDTKLKAIGVYDLVKGHKDQKSALRHLLYYISFTLTDSTFLDRLPHPDML